MIRRLKKELDGVVKNYDVEMVDEKIDRWRFALEGPENSLYDGGVFLVELYFPPSYPMVAPEVRFLTRIFHPNITSSGKICLGMLNDWKMNLSVMDVLVEIKNLLIEPNVSDPLEADVAKLFVSDPTKYNETVKNWIEKYAS